MTPNCDDCRHFLTEGEQCTLNPIHVPIPGVRYCGRFRAAKLKDPVLGNKKASDRQLWDALCEHEDGQDGSTRYSTCVLAVSARVGLTRRSVEERFKTLHKRGVIKIFRSEIEGKKGVQTASGPDGSRAPYPEGGNDPALEPAAPRSNPNLKYTFADIEHALGLEPARFSRLAEKCHKMSRPAFARVLADSVRRGLVEKTPEGLYRLADKPDSL